MPTTDNPSSVLRILDRQVQQWEIRKRLADQDTAAARREFAHLDQGPWITVSKSLASGWEAVARQVSDHLGWQVFDQQILDEISRHANVREMILSRLDERGVRPLEDATLGLALHDYPGQSAFVLEMRTVIQALATHGRTILVGRGANWFLDPAFGLRVRLLAPAESRVARLQHDEGISADQARRRIETDDARKAEFIRQVFGREINDPTGYDLVLNLGSLGQEAAAECMLAALRRKLGAL